MRGDALGVGFEVARNWFKQVELAVEDLLDPPAQLGPVGAFQIEMCAEVEQGSLADFLAASFGAHQSEGVLIFLGGASDIHGGSKYVIFHGMSTRIIDKVALHLASWFDESNENRRLTFCEMRKMA